MLYYCALAQLMSFKIRSRLKAIKHFLNFCETSIRLVDMPFPHFTVCNPHPTHNNHQFFYAHLTIWPLRRFKSAQKSFFFVINFLSLCLNEHRQSIFSRTIFKCYIVFHLKVFQIESWNSGQKVNCHYSKSRFYLKKTWFQSLWKCVDNPEIGSKDLLTQTIGNWWHKSQAQIMNIEYMHT